MRNRNSVLASLLTTLAAGCFLALAGADAFATPVITSQPLSQMTVFSGQSATFTVVVNQAVTPETIGSKLAIPANEATPIFDWLISNGYFYEQAGTIGHPQPVTDAQYDKLKTQYPSVNSKGEALYPDYRFVALCLEIPDPAVTYQWMKRAANGGAWTSIPRATGASYTSLANALTDSGDQFECVVSDSTGHVTTGDATLTVEPEPICPAANPTSGNTTFVETSCEGLAPGTCFLAGQGQTDDTDAKAFENAIGQLNKKQPGTVVVGPGVYNINARYKQALDGPTAVGAAPSGTYYGISLPSNVTLQMSPDTVLQVEPTSVGAYVLIGIFNASDVNISGGTLLGDKIDHINPTIDMGAFGFGVGILGSSNVHISNLVSTRMWGDGLYVDDYVGFKIVNNEEVITSEIMSGNTSICGSTFENNRRMGMSVISGNGIAIENSIFENTGGNAVDSFPYSCLDVEPDGNPRKSVNNLLIENSELINSLGSGVSFNPANEAVNGVVFNNNVISGNGSAGLTLLTAGPDSLACTGYSITGNVIDNDHYWSLGLDYNSQDNSITGNTIYFPGPALATEVGPKVGSNIHLGVSPSGDGIIDDSDNKTNNFANNKEIDTIQNPGFSQSMKSLAVNASNGSVLQNPNLTEYPAGLSVTLTPQAAAGYQFAGWSGANSSSDNPLVLTITANTNLTANFSKIPPLSVTISSPSQNAFFTAPANIPITATTTGVSITQVDIYNGPLLLGSFTKNPSFVWPNIGPGNYALTAHVTDSSGASATSSAVDISVTGVPVVGLTANNTSTEAPASIDLVAGASETNGSISKVEFYNGTTLLGTASNSPFELIWNHVSAGTYALTAKAFDKNGNSATSGIVNEVVNGAPQLSITSVVVHNWTWLAPASADITVNASELDGSIASVEFYNGTTLLGTATSGTNSVYTFTWKKLPPGNDTVTVKAVDAKGNSVSASSTFEYNPTR